MKNIQWFLIIIAGILLTQGCGGDNNTDETDVQPDVPLEISTPVPQSSLAGGGTVAGVAVFEGTPPAVSTFIPNKDTEVCGTDERVAQDVVIGGNGGLKNVVVSIINAPPVPLDTATGAMMDQKGCLFTPHIAQVAVGASMTFLNNDLILHNIHTTSTANLSLNKAQPGFMKRLTETFTQPEIIQVSCDVHSWMKGWIVVQDHPFYAVTDAQGAFSLDHVPAGTYTIRYWHETFGEKTMDITVVEGETAMADMKFGGKTDSN